MAIGNINHYRQPKEAVYFLRNRLLYQSPVQKLTDKKGRTGPRMGQFSPKMVSHLEQQQCRHGSIDQKLAYGLLFHRWLRLPLQIFWSPVDQTWGFDAPAVFFAMTPTSL